MSKKCEGVIRYDDKSKAEGYNSQTIFITAYCSGKTFHDVYQQFSETLECMSNGMAGQKNLTNFETEVRTIADND